MALKWKDTISKKESNPVLKPNAIFMVSSLIFILIAGCSSVHVSDYKNEKPILKLEEYFSGDLVAHGVFQDRSGMIKKRFVVAMKCVWNGNVGILDEDFAYSDGSRSRRVWTLVRLDDGSYKGTAADVVGEARGEIAGNAFQWKYVLALDVEGTIYDVTFDDWMFLMDEKVMLNKSKMYKFGIYLGEVTLSFYKQ